VSARGHFWLRKAIAQRTEQTWLPSYRPCHGRDAARSLFGARKVKIDAYVIHGCVSEATITTSLAASSNLPGRGGLCHGGHTARSMLNMDTTLREDSVLCMSKYQTCTPSAPCRELRNACKPQSNHPAMVI
jgi:hypothetical protein